MDLTFSKWEDAAREKKEKEMYSDTYRFGAGISYLPSTRTTAKYYLKLPLLVGYRFGTVNYKSYPKEGTVFERAVTFGIEFPFLQDIGSIVTSFEYGFRGDINKNGWDEKFFGTGISLITKMK